MAKLPKIHPLPGYRIGQMEGAHPDVYNLIYPTLTDARRVAYWDVKKFHEKFFVFKPIGYVDGGKHVVVQYRQIGFATLKSYSDERVVWSTYYSPIKRNFLMKNGKLGKKIKVGLI